ncbi:MAG: hypothetical protein M0010_08960 [Actinomycetota bacterium]|nr:hypothetical protein [Actinomycetota bacterium]
MTKKARIAASVPPPFADAARAAVAGGRAPNVSAYVARALEEKFGLDDLDSLLEELLLASGGPLTDSERDRIDREAGWR